MYGTDTNGVHRKHRALAFAALLFNAVRMEAIVQVGFDGVCVGHTLKNHSNGG